MLFQNPPISPRKFSNFEVLARNGSITGHVNGCYKLGVDQSTGDLYYKDLNSIWQPIVGGGGGGNQRFGFSGEDDTAGENRIFDVTGHNFSITDSNTSSDLIFLDTTNFQSFFGATDGNAFSSFVLNADLAGNNVVFFVSASDNLNLVQITGDAQAQLINLGADNGISINSAYILPLADGTAGQVMTTDGAGVATWEDGGIGNPSSIDWAVLAILNTPSGTTNTGDEFLVGTSPTGAFVGHTDEIATSTNPGYTYQTANIGDLLYDISTDTVYKYTGTGWILVGRLTLHQGGDTYGVPIVMGSRDNFNVTFRVNNVYAGSIGTSATYNTSLGILSLPANATGIHNTALGSAASGQNTTGTQNTSVGYTANYNNTTGNQNTAVGWAAGGFNIGSGNTVVGYGALNTTNPVVRAATYNTAIGWESLQNNVNHEYNIGLGIQAGQLSKTVFAPIAKDATLYISSWTNHMYFPLDSDDASPDFLIGRDDDNFWHSYPASGFTGGGGGGGERFGVSGEDDVAGEIRTFDATGYGINLNNTANTPITLQITNTGTASGIEVVSEGFAIRGTTGTSGYTAIGAIAGNGSTAIGASSTNSTAISGNATNGGTAILGTSTLGLAGDFLSSRVSRDQIETVLRVRRTTTSVSGPLVGIGSSIDFTGQLTNGATPIVSKLAVQMTNVVTGTYISDFLISGSDGGAISTLFTLFGSGGLKLSKYGIGTFEDTETFLLGVDGSGNVVEVDPSGFGGSILLQTNGSTNATQSTLNLISGTDITVSTDGAGNVTFDYTGVGGGGNTIYTANDAIVSNRTVDLNSFDLAFTDGGGTALTMSPAGGEVRFVSALLKNITVSDADDKVLMHYDANTEIELGSDSTITYTADIHIFNGSSNSLLTIDSTTFNTNLQATDSTAITLLNMDANSVGSIGWNLASSDGTTTVSIFSDPASDFITYTAGTHTMTDSTFANSITVAAGGIAFTGQMSSATILANDFLNDAAAATGLVPLGGLYHTSGAVKIRLV